MTICLDATTLFPLGDDSDGHYGNGGGPEMRLLVRNDRPQLSISNLLELQPTLETADYLNITLMPTSDQFPFSLLMAELRLEYVGT